MRATLLGLCLVLTVAGDVHAQGTGSRATSTQGRQPIEVFATMGGHFGGAVIEPQQSQLDNQWRLQPGVGVHLPLGRHWAALIDVTTSVMEAHWKWDGERPAGPGDNHARVRRITLSPALARVWRSSGLVLYVGGGVGVEQQREQHRYRRIVARVDLKPVVADVYTEQRSESIYGVPIVFKAGIVMDNGGRFVWRIGYDFAKLYMDVPGAPSVVLGVGYRLGGGN